MLDEPRAELVRRLSHDLRSPLNVLDGALKELEEDGGGDRARVLSLAGRALSRLHRLTERLSLAGRIDQGLSPNLSQVELRPLVLEVWQKLQNAEPRSKISVAVNGTATWQTDRSLLASLLGELLVNALKHARTQVTVQLEGPELTVEDDGEGVEAPLVPTLFTQVQGRRAGLGLGLPMATAVAQALSLTLSLEPTPKGALCRFALRSK
ncbi:MAG: HAMP domain-containing sensor histidine kinase [Myxococcaceae bacterium]